MSASNDDTKIEVQPDRANSGDADGILRRLKRQAFLNRISLLFRGFALIFSLISFIVVASNKHGDWMNFDLYGEYKYLLAIGIMSTLYTGGQVYRQIDEISKRRDLLKPGLAALIDFVGDQLLAYLWISSASSATPLTNRMREGNHNYSFTDASVAAICMSFFAFLSLALSAIISAYKLSAQTFI